MSYRPTGDRFKELALGQLIEKLVQMALDRLDGLLQEKKHQQWESQLALAGKVLRPHSMASQEVWIAQLSTQSFDQGNEVLGNVMNSSLHPHGNGGTAEHVQAKSLIDSMLQLIQRVWGPGRATLEFCRFLSARLKLLDEDLRLRLVAITAGCPVRMLEYAPISFLNLFRSTWSR